MKFSESFCLFWERHSVILGLRFSTLLICLAMPRNQAIMECTECHRRNYTTTRNAKTMPARLELLKFCPHDRKRTIHKEIKGK